MKIVWKTPVGKFQFGKLQFGNSRLESFSLENSTLENSFLENSSLKNSSLENYSMENSSFLNSSLENTSLEISLVEKPTMKFYKCICMKYSKCLVTFDGPIMNPPQIASFGVWAANSLPYEIMMSLEPCAKLTMDIFE